MELLKKICPDSSYVWNASGISPCLDDLVLGFGGNIVTVIMLATFGIVKRTYKDNRMVPLLVEVLFRAIPAFGVGIAFVDIIVLATKNLNSSYDIPYHEWLYRSSQLAVWVTVLLVSKCCRCFVVFCNQFLCFWWIMKPFLSIMQLQRDFSSNEVITCVKEIFVALLDVIFAILINIIRLKSDDTGSSPMEESLLSGNVDIEEGCSRDLPKGIVGSFWSLATFKSIDSVLEHGIEKQLDFEDLLELPLDMDPSSCHTLLLNHWESQQRKNFSDPSLFKTVCSAYGWPYLCLGFLKVVNDCLGFASPLLLNKLIQFLQEGSTSYDGYVLAVSMGLTSVLKSFLDTQYTFRLSKLKLKLRSSIMTLIYRKCLCTNLAERSKFSEGEIQTFMSVDADRTVNLCNSFHDMWSLPLQIGIALYLLYEQVKFAFVAGIAITILLIPVNKWIANLIASATKNMMEQKDERIRRTAELLTNVRTLKMFGWEFLFASWLTKTRSVEVAYLSTRKYLDAWCVFFWATTPTLFSLFTFGLYTLMGYKLDAATVFTCLALFNNLISPLNSFPWVINGLIDAIISTRRLSRYLSCFEHEPEKERTANSLFLPDPNKQSSSEDVAIFIHDASCTWSSSDEKQLDLVLDHVTLHIPKGLLVAVVGEVGSGKSSLLNLILGEMKLVNGSIHVNGSTAYVPQVPWILSGTIRDNILFGRDYDPRRYSEVLRVCSLDFDISRMVGGDSARVGEKGLNLSGGQRARLALARAIYHGAHIYMLDDILSAVDAHVACSILQTAILGPVMKQRTRILCTHNLQAITAADIVVVMDKGHIKWVGNPADLSCPSSVAFSTVDELSASPTSHTEERRSSMSAEPGLEVSDSDSISISDEAQDIIEIEQRKEGRVELMVYKKYAAFSGWVITFVTGLSAIMMQATRNGNDLWLSYWVDSTGSNQKAYSTTFYLNLTSAPIRFFDQTPSGRILNRLSSDLYTIDDSLPFILNILLANFIGLLGIAVVLSYVQIVFLFLLLPFWFIYSKLQLYYRSTSRELRRLDSVSRSPIYASFTETIDGSSTIRAFKSTDIFLIKFFQHLMVYQRTSYSEVMAGLWLSLRLQLLAAFIVSFIAVMAVLGSHGYLHINLGTPGLVGLALSYAAPIVSNLGSFLSSFTETEKEMVSVERVLQYMDIPQEELIEDQRFDQHWPFQGDVNFQNVTLRYMPSLPPALRGVSFTISGGTQVGIIGRTGAGKSSILNALFCLYPICGGHIIVDGIDTAHISLRDLRERLSVVPQVPFLFEGSLRSNLDPLDVSEDMQIWEALDKCHLKEEVEAAGGLDMNVKGSGAPFSVGQRQLLCLARALLKSSKVLCLDECTASVDTQTASKLQKVIMDECQGTTVITIAHRISTVVNMDNILILDQGILVEQGNPHHLLEDESSLFSSFAKASNM
ncbi:PREDICTED: ABC transporter C family member 13 isoform X2 [Ipomoea nil]|uniref:ABC transporter C family member 13 isoform X2 n=1 Tax=Ipomoea nil TaxID=35883 RepID=UPI000900CE17|nr:PREDICTED: ABC transporter C family member 13 isoform X2 [Ipomoea nil]